MYQFVIYTNDETGVEPEIKRTNSERKLSSVLSRCEKYGHELLVFTGGRYYDRIGTRSHLIPLAA